MNEYHMSLGVPTLPDSRIHVPGGTTVKSMGGIAMVYASICMEDHAIKLKQIVLIETCPDLRSK